MWLAIQSVKDKETDIVISAGNTGAFTSCIKIKFKNDRKYRQTSLICFMAK